ncbi:protein of unknown function [Parapedobacter luteus]|uniref:DUF4136 domain-containing protein n=1 Tax=Parapedobacter luteus TaxID=623280 RepID=A0A1T5A496_9SPHI|nr:DUF4136 domain-containing protein [Parapedobacter luteus]SKB29547.1 protein of unknown function [Parapedobacter luteus]
MKRLLLYIAPLLLLASCSSYKYHTTKIEGTDFSQYRTYGWLPPVDSLSKSYFDNDIAQANIMETANRELEARGLTYSKDNPDLLFRYIAIVNNKNRPIYGGYPFGPWGFWGYNPWMWGPGWGLGWGYGWNRPIGQERYRAGHIIIEAKDRRTNRVIWQARGTGEVRNPEQAINKLPEVVTGVIEQLPLPVTSSR